MRDEVCGGTETHTDKGRGEGVSGDKSRQKEGCAQADLEGAYVPNAGVDLLSHVTAQIGPCRVEVPAWLENRKRCPR